MEKIYRVYTEKKAGFDVAATNLYNEINAQLNIKNLAGIRVIARYDVAKIDEATFNTARLNVFAEPNDNVFDTFYYGVCGDTGCLVRRLQTGTYDQRADSAEQCIRLLCPESSPKVSCATVYVFTPKEGAISSEDYQKLKEYLINPVETTVGCTEIPETLDDAAAIPADVKVMDGFIDLKDGDMATLVDTMGLAMSKEDCVFIRDYFKTLKRNPTITEIKVIDTYWSDHCRHTTFMTVIDDVSFLGDRTGAVKDVWDRYVADHDAYYAGRERPRTLMDLATLAGKIMRKEGIVTDIDESEEINACSVNVDVDIDGKNVPYLVMFKNETHNHPTEIEPFGGAATCLGGAIRDPLSGRSYVYQAMRVTGAGDPLTPFDKTLSGKLPQRAITVGAAQGYSSYGNQIGLATGLVHEFYDNGYTAKRMEIGAVIAAAPKANVIRERPEAGDIILLIGGRTGRDGCGGATGASKSHTKESLATCGAEVQKGNPLTERKLQRLFRNPAASTLIKRCNDFGAGGVSVAVGELADSLDINLDAVTKKYEGLDGTELAISESQERMAVVVKKENEAEFIRLAATENLECVRVAVVTDSGHMRISWRGKTIVDLERAFLDTNGVSQHITAAPDSDTVIDTDKQDIATEDIPERLTRALSALNGCSQRGLCERFDSTIGANTVLMPFGGKNQLTPTQVMAARIPLESGTTQKGTVMSFGFDPKLSTKSPFHGAMYAVMESVLRLSCAGADGLKARLSCQEYFEKLYADPKRWGKPLAALLGAYHAQRELNTPAIGGKDSMSGTFMDLNVPPTLVSFAMVPADTSKLISRELKTPRNKLYVLRTLYDTKSMPNFEKFKELCAQLTLAIQSGDVVAASTVEPDGIMPTVARMAFGNMLGVDLSVNSCCLFRKMPCSVIIELKSGVDVDKYFEHIPLMEIGTITHKNVINACGATITLADAYKAWAGTLEGVFKTKPVGEVINTPPALKFTERNTRRPAAHIASPRVVIPVFPGTNCEYDSQRAFVSAGALVTTPVILNTAKGDIEASTEYLAKLISNAQIVMLPGGFSAGDEPDGSGKFSANVLRNSRVRDAMLDLINNRDGLILGICNGFQTLIKLGLVPYGDIIDFAAKDAPKNPPTLTYNAIGRHQSRITHTRVCSTLSPWFSGLEVGEVLAVPISHGEGRFVCPDIKQFSALVSHGQIATQYVGLTDTPSMDADYNPATSYCAVEGITSPDGRILGKMGHSERWQPGLYRNIDGNFDSRIFASGVKYFE